MSLKLSENNRWIGGVCGGIGQELNVDPIIPRILFLIAFFGFGTGIIIYLILWLIMALNK
jgi:phage shock protein C